MTRIDLYPIGHGWYLLYKNDVYNEHVIIKD